MLQKVRFGDKIGHILTSQDAITSTQHGSKPTSEERKVERNSKPVADFQHGNFRVQVTAITGRPIATTLLSVSLCHRGEKWKRCEGTGVKVQ